MVPMLTCGLVRSNFAFATGVLLWSCCTPYFIGARVIFAGLRAAGASDAPLAVRGGMPLSLPVKPSAGTTAGLLALGLRDDLLGDVLGNLGVGVELHRVARATRRLAAEVADVAEHLRQRHQALDDPGAAALLHGLDLATAGVEVADDVAHGLLGRGDLDGHHRLEEDGARLAGALLEGLRTGDLERQLGG